MPETGLTTPQIYDCTEHPDACWIWMEDLGELQRPRGLADLRLVARRLGRFNGAYLTGHPLPDYPWLSDGWHCAIAEGLLGKRTEDSLRKEAGGSPEFLITLHTAWGLWAEGSGDREGAIEHYKEAMSSFLDTWIQFEFARERIKSLRVAEEKPS